MVFVILRTNKTLTLKQQRYLKNFISDMILSKGYKNIIMQFETNQVIYLNKKMKDCILLNCILENEIDDINIDILKEEICDEINKITLVEKEFIFVSLRFE